MDIRLCGRLAVEHHGEPLHQKLPGRQGRLLLAYLALSAGQEASRDELIDAVWHEHPPASPDAALRTVLSRLRGALPEGTIEGRRELSLRLRTEDRLDVQEAETALERARAGAAGGDWEAAEASARTALGILRAPLLPGHEAPWLDDWRRRLVGRAAEALELCASAGVRRTDGDLTAAEAAAHELVEREPYRESGYLCLMEVQAARGNAAEALRVYEELRLTLRDELGTTPGPRVKAFHNQLLRGEAVPLRDGSPARGLPPPSSGSFGAESMPLPGLLARFGDQRLLGRQSELERLAVTWREAVKGQHRVVFLAGEAGVGKTSLAARFACKRQASGASVLYGRADPEALIPYQPFVEALRHLATNAPVQTLQATAPELSELSRLVPEFRRRLPELEPAPKRGGGDDRYRLFSAAATLLAEVANHGSLLLVLDDLHWADASSLRLLRHIARYSDPAPLLILGSFRDTDLQRSPELADTLTELRREHLHERILLTGLDKEAVGELVAEATRSTPPGLTEVLHEQTRGNPLFVEEMLRHLANEDALRCMEDAPTARELVTRVGVPEGVREVIERRLRGLDARVREALTLGAVLGQEFDVEVLAAVGGSALGDVEDPLEEALADRLLIPIEGVPGRLGFSHALVRETLYQRPAAMRRCMLHRRVGEALEALFSENLEANAAELARHFLAAGTRDVAEKAIRYSIAAAEQATGRLAHEEAAAHYARALERTEPGLAHCELLLKVGKARFRSGDASEGRAAFREAAAEARALGAHEHFAQATLGFSGRRAPVAGGRVDREAVALLEEALDRLPDSDSRLRAAVLGQLAVEIYWSGDESKRDALSREAVAVGRRTRDRAALADALLARRFAVWAPDTLEERLRIGREILSLAERTGDRNLAMRGQQWRIADLLHAGDLDAVRREVAIQTHFAKAMRRPLHLWVDTIFRAMLAVFEGRLEVGERLAREAYALGQRANWADAPYGLAAQLVAIRRDQGRFEGVLEIAHPHAGRGADPRPWRCFLAVCSAEQRQEAEARRELDRWATDGFRSIPRDIDWLFCLACLAEVAAYLGDADASAALYELLRPYADRNVVTAYAAVCSGSVSRYLGLLAATTRRFDDAVLHFEHALETHARWGARPWLARTQHGYAQMLLERGGAAECDRAGELLEQALGSAREIGMQRLAVEVERILAAAPAPHVRKRPA